MVSSDIKQYKLSDDAIDWLENFEDYLNSPDKKSLDKYNLAMRKDHVMKVMRLDRYKFDPKADCSKQDWYSSGKDKHIKASPS